MEEDGSCTLLRRTLHKAVRAMRAIARLRPSPTTTTPATTPSRLPPSLLDCTDDDDAAWTAGSPSFHTASSTPDGTVHSRLPSPGAAEVEVDVDGRAAEFIERFWRNGSLELRYCSPVTPIRPPVSPDTYFNLSRLHGSVHDHGSPVTPIRPPVSPDTYFNLSRLHGSVHDHGSPVHARPTYGRVSPRPSGVSIKWPNNPDLTGRPSVQV